jgi:hypothetical protein
MRAPLYAPERASTDVEKAAAATTRAAQTTPTRFNMTLLLRYHSFDYLFNLPIETKLL